MFGWHGQSDSDDRVSTPIASSWRATQPVEVDRATSQCGDSQMNTRELAIRVRTPSRLHFGLLSFGQDASRQFGGVGVAVQQPGNELVVGWQSPDDSNEQNESSVQHRVRGYAQLFLQGLEGATREALPPNIQVRVVRAAAEHVGLGTGTQLALAVGRGMSIWARMSEMTIEELAQRMGRGMRSAIGVHGFEGGGFIVEGGKRNQHGISPMLTRLDFPPEWHFVLVIPRDSTGLHGKAERDAFDDLEPVPLAVTADLCRLTLLGMMPAILERDYVGFSEALFEFGRKVGECFAPCQGGVYASGIAEQIIGLLRQHGIQGAAQSSWGPTMCAVTESRFQAEWVAARLRDTLGEAIAEIICTPVDNHGASTELLDGE